MKVQSSRRLIKDVESFPGVALGEFLREFDSLGLASG